MRIPTVKSARIRFHSPELECDVLRRIGWYVRWPNGDKGKLRRTRPVTTAGSSVWARPICGRCPDGSWSKYVARRCTLPIGHSGPHSYAIRKLAPRP